MPKRKLSRRGLERKFESGMLVWDTNNFYEFLYRHITGSGCGISELDTYLEVMDKESKKEFIQHLVEQEYTRDLRRMIVLTLNAL